ncbi:MAG: hypothetical protein R2781_02945 [Flavobacteriaceae bacterium]
MKKRLLLIACCYIISNHVASSQTFNDPVAYLEFVANEQNNITKTMWQYTKAIAHSKSDRTIENKRNTVIKSLQRAIAKIEKAESFNNDYFKEKVLDNLKLNESLMKNEYEKIIDMKEVAEQSYDAMEAYVLAREMADKKMTEAQQIYEANYIAYAARHQIKLLESETDLGKKMEISSKVFDYYNKMYLAFFKVYINEIYLFDAIERNDISAMQQNANALSEAAKEGKDSLSNIELYKNDTSILQATHKAFDFFIEEANDKMPILIDFLVKNSDFETLQQTLENTPERKRSKEQIDDYNNKVKDINKAVKVYNETNEILNKKRQEVMNDLSIANQKFLGKHIPND